MAIELKEIQDAVEDGIKVLKKDWTDTREKDQKKFDDKVVELLEKFETASSKEDVTKGIDEAKGEMQKQFDSAMTEIKEAGKGGNTKFKSFAQSLQDTLAAEHKNLVDNIASKSNYAFDMKDFNFSNFDGYEPFVTEMRGLREKGAIPFHWRDIVPNGKTSKDIISYPKVGEDTGAPAPWAYGTGVDGANESKPQFAPNLTVESDKVEWIAGIIKNIPISMLEDLPWLQSFLGRRAQRALLKAEDLQIWAGTGVSPQLNGFQLNSVAYNGAYTNLIEIIVDAALRQIADNGNVANAAVISNTDKVSMILNKSDGSGVYNLPAGAIGYVNGQFQISGLNVYSGPQMAPGKGIIGDFNESEFVIRSAPRLRWFDQNEDDATKNVVMLRIEERAALAIYDELAFVRIGDGI